MSAFSRFSPLVLVLATGTALWADDTTTTPPPPKTVVRADIDLALQQTPVEIETVTREVNALKARAEKEKDVIKLSCVNDKLVQLKAQMNIADDQAKALRAAADKDPAEAAAAYNQLSVTRVTIRKVHEEAKACMGRTELLKQDSGLDVTKPDIIDDPDDQDPYEVDPAVDIEPPGYASPFA